jgi:hypothetical protein
MMIEVVETELGEYQKSEYMYRDEKVRGFEKASNDGHAVTFESFADSSG